jgi:hypothetical protein
MTEQSRPTCREPSARCTYSLLHRPLLAVLVGLCLPGAAKAAELTSSLDSAVDRRFLDTLFGRFGSARKSTVLRDPRGIRFQMPGTGNNAGQTGLYSLFSLAGDFEISADYNFIDVPAPTAGYGASCGIAVDAKGPSGQVQFVRVNLAPRGWRYRVGRDPTGTRQQFEDTDYPARATTGRLVLRREAGTLVCLAAEKSGELEELTRFEFPQMVERVRFFVDSGGSPTAMDVRLAPIRIQAEKKATDPTEVVEQRLPWWGTVLLIVGGAGLSFLIYRFFVVSRRRRMEN